MIDSKDFRRMAELAVDRVARFLDEYPNLYCTMRIGGPFGVIVVGVEEDDEKTSDPEYDRVTPEPK